MESQEQQGGTEPQTDSEEKTDREEGGPTGVEGEPAPEEGAESTRPNPMPAHE